MLFTAVLAITLLLVEPLPFEDFLTQPIPSYARELTGTALVDYVNSRQTLFKAEFSENAREFLSARLMDQKYMYRPEETTMEKEVVFHGDIPESFDAREKWSLCPSVNYIRDQSACGTLDLFDFFRS
ncbi:hypothetical protein OESDEN_09611 [Oesophagostomum dentatum]|uniref:Uncharacterized protein n=1 Tax=Oesophagostomum dentatum TaxID=61180 RepID=A0A0B1T583_OESDE|nr:hypothetical protein OESDEN_09611 [Oesophagostomum dentatum]